MKHSICVAALMIVATQTFAADGKLSQTALQLFGLSGIQLVSDAEGMDVRGTSSYVYVAGTSESDIGSFFSSEDTYSFNGFEGWASNNNDSQAEGGSESFSHESTNNSGSINYQGFSDVIIHWGLVDAFTIGSGGGAYAFAN